MNAITTIQAEADSKAPHVYRAINGVMAEIARQGIAKDRSNTQQGYKFRGIDDVYNALSSILSGNGLMMLPRVLSREISERASNNGKPVFYVTVDMEFDLISREDGSRHTIRTIGEAMDMADKATNKAMSAAYKYAAMQAFCIPTEGDNDADATTITLASAENLEALLNELQGALAATTSREDFTAAWLEMKPKAERLNDQQRKRLVDFRNTNAKRFPAPEQSEAA